MNFVNLKDYIKTLESGKRPKGGAVNSGIPSLGGEHINANGGFNIQKEKLKYVPCSYYNSLKKGIINNNDILIVKDGATTGKVAYVDNTFSLDDACINEHVFLLRTKESLDAKYLFYFFYSQKGQQEILKDFRGATVGGISKEFININFYLPSLNQQKRVICALDIAKELIDKRKSQIEALDELVKSQFIEMFGDPISNNKNWPCDKLENVALKITDGKHGDCENEENSGFYFISAKDINERRICTKNARQITKIDFDETNKRTMLEVGDIVIVNTGATIGKTAIVTEGDVSKNLTFQKSVAIVTVNLNKLLSEFLEQYIIFDRDNIYANSSGSAQKNWLLSQMRSYRIMIPPMELQNEFLKFVKQVDKLKVEMQKSLKELEDNFNSLMQKAFK
jgi:type I restriction enzyme S subunit